MTQQLLVSARSLTAMCAQRAAVLTDEEEKRLSKLRNKLLDWGKADWKVLVRDEAPSEVYSDKTGFSIYLGGNEHARDVLGLEVLGVTYILNMAAGDPTCRMTQEVYGDKYRCMRIIAGDMPGYDLSKHFQETWQFIEEARESKAKVLVHCVAGVSRSATIVIAYLMQLQHWTLQTAAKHVSKRRPKIFPNLGFMKQLQSHQAQLTATVGKLH